MPASANPVVEFVCAKGRMEIVVFSDQAPVTAANFLSYVDAGHLNGSAIFRIVTPENDSPQRRCDARAAQWGWRPKGAAFKPDLGRGWDPMDTPDDLPFAPIPLETTTRTGLRHRRGTVSMGRDASDLSGPHFFFCAEDSPYFDAGGARHPDGRGFAAFAQVMSGLSVIERIFEDAEPMSWMMSPLPILSVHRKG